MKLKDLNTVQLRCVNKLLLSGNLRTDVLAGVAGTTRSDVMYQMLHLRNAGLVSSYNEGPAYVVWSLLPKMREMLQKDAREREEAQRAKIKQPTVYLVTSKRVNGAPTKANNTFAKESDAMSEALKRAHDMPGSFVEIYERISTVVKEPNRVIEGDLIIN